MRPLPLLLALPCAGASAGAYPLSAQTRTFSIAHKPGLGIKPGEELLLFNYTPSAPGTHCVMQSWFTGSLPWPQFGDTLIRFYIDGEPQPSVSITINNLVGLGDANASTTHEHVPAPWGNAHHGVVGVGGGVYTATRVPFGTALRITATMSPGQTEGKSLYAMHRGLENMPVILEGSGLQLPPAARLRSYSARAVPLQPMEWHTLLGTGRSAEAGAGAAGGGGGGAPDDEAGGGGALLMLLQTVRSGNSHCLEGTHIATIDGAETILSSGFEDYYLSGQYFDAGPFATPISGSETLRRLPSPSPPLDALRDTSVGLRQ